MEFTTVTMLHSPLSISRIFHHHKQSYISFKFMKSVISLCSNKLNLYLGKFFISPVIMFYSMSAKRQFLRFAGNLKTGLSKLING